jgi:hypothetical protein
MSRLLAAGLALGAALLVGAPAWAVITGGGGSSRTDCLAVFDAAVNFPPARPKHIKCADGDACDADGLVNGVCSFPVAVCANSTFDPRCTLAGVQTITVDHALDNGERRFDPDFQALQTRIDTGIDLPTTDADQCTLPAMVRVDLRGPFPSQRCGRSRKTIVVRTVSTVIDGRVYREKDKLRLTCEPAPGPCDPQLLFGGTFDRIQRQIFDRSCAVSGCHDSQSVRAGLLLETGASLSNLVGVVPTNGAAAGAGWHRVTAGDAETSLLFHKLKGGLPAGFGQRMPFGGRRLDRFLIDVVELWIAAGAPDTGWVPGTD